MPMKEETIFRILRGEFEEHNITPDDIFTYEDRHEYTGYIASATIRPEHKIHLRGLVRDVFDYWCEQYPNVKINKLYAYASSDTGWELVSHFYFAPRYDIGDNAFELDLSRRNPNRLVSDFQSCLRKKTGKPVTR
ncbi:hypothetical protein [Dictyobacter aurantiacus]|nr:hypothetical protein [Dictyobacter aurantiacus]